MIESLEIQNKVLLKGNGDQASSAILESDKKMVSSTWKFKTKALGLHPDSKITKNQEYIIVLSVKFHNLKFLNLKVVLFLINMFDNLKIVWI